MDKKSGISNGKGKKRPFRHYGKIKTKKLHPQEKHFSQCDVDSYKDQQRNAELLMDRMPIEKIEKLGAQTEGAILLGPKFCFKMGFLNDEGYRPGFTKQTLERRVMKNRQKEKNRRKANRRNR